MLPNFVKPVIFTGSQFPDYLMRYPKVAEEIALKSEDIGIRANLINAIHVVKNGMSGVHVLFGDKLIEGRGLELTPAMLAVPFRYPREQVVGRVEFSIKRAPEYKERVREGYGGMRLSDALETRIVCAKINPLFHLTDIASALSDCRGALFYLETSVSYPDHLISAIRNMQPKIPIVFAGQSMILPEQSSLIAQDLEKEGVILIGGETRERVMVRFMWALGQTSDVHEIKRLMSDA